LLKDRLSTITHEESRYSNAPERTHDDKLNVQFSSDSRQLMPGIALQEVKLREIDSNKHFVVHQYSTRVSIDGNTLFIISARNYLCLP